MVREHSGRHRVGALLLGAGVVTALLAGGPVVHAAPAQVHFTAAGDYNGTPDTTAVLTGTAAAAPDLNLALGDFAYGSTGNNEQAWCDYVVSKVGAGFPFELISGNHESDGTLNGNINNFSSCLPNQLPGAVGTYGRQWYVDYPKIAPTVRFVMISPGLTFPDGPWSYAAGTPRYQWTAAAIDGARTAGIPWVVVGMHKPCLSLGQYTCDPGTDLMNLLVSKKVDLVLTGHEHLYQRTKQLALGTGCTAVTAGTVTSACISDADDDLVRGAGTVFVTAGTGGTPLRDVTTTDTEADYFRVWEGLNISPSYGFLDVTADADTLSGRFVATSGTFTDAFTMRRATTPPPNQLPTAVIAAPACSALACTFDGSGSSDPDGSIASYAWDFGDGTTGSGAKPNHTYAAAGTYTVSLVVTDNSAGTASATRSVTVAAAPTSTTLASDTFTRTLSGSLGKADVGGTWSGSGASYAVSGGEGKIVMQTPGSGPASNLPGTASTSSADLALTLSIDKAATGSGVYFDAVARRITGAGDYRGKLQFRSDQSVRLSISRVSGGAETSVLPAVVVPGLTYAPGDKLRVRVQATGVSPTQLRAKVWRVGAAEPASWLLSGSDATAALQAAGGFSVDGYLSGTATNAPITASIDDLLAITPAP